jgi:hypothetical protein
MKNISQYLEEYRKRFVRNNFTDMGWDKDDCKDLVPPLTEFRVSAEPQDLEDFFRASLTEVAKGMVGEESSDIGCTCTDFEHNFCGSSYNKAIAEQEEKFNKFIQ